MRTGDTHFTTAHLPRTRKWKNWLIRLLIIAVVISILLFPYEIGQFIGSWFNEFVKGINLK